MACLLPATPNTTPPDATLAARGRNARTHQPMRHATDTTPRRARCSNPNPHHAALQHAISIAASLFDAAQRQTREAHLVERALFRNDIIECNTGAARLAAYYEPSTSKSCAPPSACSVFEAHHLLRLASCTASHRQAQESCRETSARCVQAGARVASLYVTHAAPCCRITAVHGSNPPHVRVQPLNACTLRCLNVHSYMRHARNRPLP